MAYKKVEDLKAGQVITADIKMSVFYSFPSDDWSSQTALVNGVRGAASKVLFRYVLLKFPERQHLSSPGTPFYEGEIRNIQVLSQEKAIIWKIENGM